MAKFGAIRPHPALFAQTGEFFDLLLRQAGGPHHRANPHLQGDLHMALDDRGNGEIHQHVRPVLQKRRLQGIGKSDSQGTEADHFPDIFSRLRAGNAPDKFKGLLPNQHPDHFPAHPAACPRNDDPDRFHGLRVSTAGAETLPSLPLTLCPPGSNGRRPGYCICASPDRRLLRGRCPWNWRNRSR